MQGRAIGTTLKLRCINGLQTVIREEMMKERLSYGKVKDPGGGRDSVLLDVHFFPSIIRAVAAILALGVALYAWRKGTVLPAVGESWQMGLVLFAGVPFAALMVCLPGAAILVLVPDELRPNGLAGRFATVIGGSSAVWWLALWAWPVAPWFGRAVGLGVLGVSSAVLAWNPRQSVRVLRGPALALGVGVGLTIAINGILFVHGGLGLGHRFVSAATYTEVDNSFPLIWADRLFNGTDLRVPEGYWPMTDRPPLQTALLLATFREGANPTGYQIVSSVLQSWAASAGAVLLVVRGLRTWRLLAALLLVTMTISFGWSTVFVWPKLLPAGMLIAAIALVLERQRNLTPFEWGAVGVLCGASLVAHPGGVFAFPILAGALVLPPDGVTRIRHRVILPDRRSALALVAGSTWVLAPWLAYRRFVDDTRSLISMWHLAGVNDPTERRPLIGLMVDQLSSLGLGGWLMQRVRNLSTVVGLKEIQVPQPWWNRMVNVGVWSPFWSGGLLWPLSPSLALSWRSTASRISSARLAACGLAAVLLWICIEYGPPVAPAVTHHGPMAAFLVISLAIAEALATQLNRWILTGLVTVQVLWFGILWWPKGERLNCGALTCPAELASAPPGNIVWSVLLAAIAGTAVLLLSIWTLRASDEQGAVDTPIKSEMPERRLTSKGEV